MPVPVQTIVRRVLTGLTVVGAGEPIKPATAQAVLDALNETLDLWNADGQSSIAEVYTTFVTVPSLNPHTIGPTGTWVLPVRPVTIDGIASVIGGVYSNIAVHTDPGWWLNASVFNPGVLSQAFYNPSVPNGELYFTGLPASGTSVRIMTRTTLADLILTQSVNLAPGWRAALTLTVMEAVADDFHAVLTPNQIRRAGQARATIFANNLRVPSLSLGGQGVPGSRGGWWDYRTGEWR